MGAELPEKLDLRSHDIAEDKRKELLRLFPEIQTEGGKLDIDRLKLALGESVDIGKERYGMNWPGKADCFKTIQMPSLATLRPCPEESIDFEATENLIIEGDNLEVLKLLQKSYLGKVKMIYIDPPYNTGNDFIYPDNYSESLQTYLEYTGQVDAEGRKFGTNTDTDGRFHSKWLNMMYPRLYLARNLLREDGVIFISIDDNEDSNLKKLCNEVFGEENCLVQFSWRTDGNFDNQAKFKRCHEYILVYAKNEANFPYPPVIDPNTSQDSKLFLEDIRNTIVKNGPKNPVSEVKLPIGFPSELGDGTIGPRTDSWPHYLQRAETKEGKLTSKITVKSGWSSKDLLLDFIRNDCKPVMDSRGQETCFVISSSGAIEAIKKRSEKTSHVITTLSGFGGPQKATSEIEQLGMPFNDYPKPTGLLKYFLQMNEGNEFVVLDFFAGSGTTAQAVLELNNSDGGKRKFILVQLPETLDPDIAKEKSAAEFCAAIGKPRNIVEITKERVRRAIMKMNDADKSKLNIGWINKCERGFRVFKLAESNFNPWNAEVPHEALALEHQLDLHVDHIRDSRTEQDLLYEILLKSGFPLTTPIEPLELAEKTVHSVAGGALFICLDRSLTLEMIRAMAERKPERVVCLDEGFADNDQLKANAVHIFKTKEITSFKTV